MTKELKKATFAGGCFWCTEAVFKRLKGVTKVVAGYSGGSLTSPSYEMVSGGNTHHAEAIQITFDPKVITYQTLLEVFWKTHDPTTKDRQGADVGSQYRSVIFYHDDDQKNAALKSKEEMGRSKFYNNSIVTEVVPFDKFYKAEGYHQNYYDQNPNKPYCMLVIDPKIQKLYKDFSDIVK